MRIWDSRKTKSSSKNPWFSLDKFDGLRIRQATNSSGYEFIKWDLWSSRLTNLTGYELVGLRISRATNEYCENPWVLAGRIGRATNEYCEIPGVLAGRMSTVRSGGFTQKAPRGGRPRQNSPATPAHAKPLKPTRTLKLRSAVRELYIDLSNPTDPTGQSEGCPRTGYFSPARG